MARAGRRRPGRTSIQREIQLGSPNRRQPWEHLEREEKTQKLPVSSDFFTSLFFQSRVNPVSFSFPSIHGTFLGLLE